MPDPKTKTPKIILITENSKYDQDSGRYNKFIEFNGRKFKIQYEVRNGARSMSAHVMDPNGIFQYILTERDLGTNFAFNASYVSSENLKQRDAKLGTEVIEKMIQQIYK
jgi:hypothetical protein